MEIDKSLGQLLYLPSGPSMTSVLPVGAQPQSPNASHPSLSHSLHRNHNRPWGHSAPNSLVLTQGPWGLLPSLAQQHNKEHGTLPKPSHPERNGMLPDTCHRQADDHHAYKWLTDSCQHRTYAPLMVIGLLCLQYRSQQDESACKAYAPRRTW